MGADYEVRPLEPPEFSHWEDLLKRSAQGTLFHSSGWLGASGTAYRLYGCFKGAELRGGLALAVLAPGIAGHPLLTPYLGVVFAPATGKYVAVLSNEKAICLVLAKRLQQDFQYVTCQFAPEMTDLQPFLWQAYITSVSYTYRLDVTDLGRAWDNMDATRRNDIRRAEKDGIVIATDVPFPEVLTLVGETYARQQRPVRFASIAQRLNEYAERAQRCQSFLARDKAGVNLAAVYLVWDEKRAYYLLGGYPAQASHHGAGALALWEAMRFTRQTLGLPQFDFEGSSIPAIERFFRKFGASLTAVYRVNWQHESFRRLPNRVRRKLAQLRAAPALRRWVGSRQDG